MDNIKIYQKTILDHSKKPENYKILKPCTHHAKANNPLCGDKVEIFTNINSDNIAKNITFHTIFYTHLSNCNQLVTA